MPGARGLRRAVPPALVELARPGEGAIPGPEMLRLGQVVLTATIVCTNLIGAVAVLAIALYVVPMPHLPGYPHVRLVNLLVGLGYIALAVPAGAALGFRGMLALRLWLAEGGPAGEAEKRFVLRAPLRLFLIQFALWLTAAVLFGALDLAYSTALALRVITIIVLAGAVTAACAYLLTEILLRPVAARALGDGQPGAAVPGVATRLVLAWATGTGLPLIGLVALGVLAMTGDRSSDRHHLAVAMVVLGATGLIVGLLAVTVAARATADPVASVRRALSRVRQGDFRVRVPVYDGTQIGQLQMGFNEMVQGLAERERMREVLGAYVDPDVAERVLEEGVDLSGERVEVTIMFIDVRDFTGLVERTAPEAVLEALNALFTSSVEVIHEKGGRVDKFVGDGLLAVFGAPRRLGDHAARGLSAARAVAARARERGQLEIGIGLDSGEVLAGNVGGAGRLEFTVIGDAVNVASRVEAVTRETGDVILLTERTRELLGEPERAGLQARERIELRGRREPLALYAAV